MFPLKKTTPVSYAPNHCTPPPPPKSHSFSNSQAQRRASIEASGAASAAKKAAKLAKRRGSVAEVGARPSHNLSVDHPFRLGQLHRWIIPYAIEMISESTRTNSGMQYLQYRQRSPRDGAGMPWQWSAR